MRFSIFRPTKSFEAKERRFNFIHYAFKSKIFFPMLRLLERFLGKVMIRKRQDIPNDPQNINFYILWDTFEKAEKEWWYKFKQIDHMEPTRKQKHINDWDNREDQHFYKYPKLLLRLLLTICLEDTAYRELLNFFLFRLQGNMNKHYNPEIKHEFPMYTSQYDQHIPYFIEWMVKAKRKGQIKIDIGKKNNKSSRFKFNLTEEELSVLNMFKQLKERGEGRLVFEFTKGDENSEGNISNTVKKGDSADKKRKKSPAKKKKKA